MSVHIQATDFVGTPFNARTAPLNFNQRWVAWDKYHIVDTFNGFDAEYHAIRNAAATIDMSPLGEIRHYRPRCGTVPGLPGDT